MRVVMRVVRWVKIVGIVVEAEGKIVVGVEMLMMR
jgi:hypothetical protein